MECLRSLGPEGPPRHAVGHSLGHPGFRGGHSRGHFGPITTLNRIVHAMGLSCSRVRFLLWNAQESAYQLSEACSLCASPLYLLWNRDREGDRERERERERGREGGREGGRERERERQRKFENSQLLKTGR